VIDHRESVTEYMRASEAVLEEGELTDLEKEALLAILVRL
jgi:hypothetical protein